MSGDPIDMRMFAQRAGTNVVYPAGSIPNFALYIMGAMARRIRGKGQAM